MPFGAYWGRLGTDLFMNLGVSKSRFNLSGFIWNVLLIRALKESISTMCVAVFV